MKTQLFRPVYQVDECLAEVRKVLESGWTGTGERCTTLEREWCSFAGAKHSHFVSSATAALHIAVRLLDLSKGSRIATTPLTFVSTNAAILYEGHVPVFCDCGKTLSLSFDSVYKAIKEKDARAVVWVHHGGNVSNQFYQLMDAIRHEKLNVKVIEDCAHASGAFYADGSRVGSRTDTISCFSFHSVKNMPVFDGGMLCVPDDEGDKRARRLSWMGIDKNTFARTLENANEVYKWCYNIEELGWKYNGNDIAASIGLVQLKYLDRDNAYRRQLYDWYLKNLKGGLECVEHNDGSSHHLFVIKTKNRDGIMSLLKANGLAPGVHYLPNYEFPVFSNFDHEDCVNVKRLATEIISLPNHLQLTRQNVGEICEVLLK